MGVPKIFFFPKPLLKFNFFFFSFKRFWGGGAKKPPPSKLKGGGEFSPGGGFKGGGKWAKPKPQKPPLDPKTSPTPMIIFGGTLSGFFKKNWVGDYRIFFPTPQGVFFPETFLGFLKGQILTFFSKNRKNKTKGGGEGFFSRKNFILPLLRFGQNCKNKNF